ncbi:hypothetical protein IJ541_10960 [bacterium]|nr:hypothetical protein [bacterium]
MEGINQNYHVRGNNQNTNKKGKGLLYTFLGTGLATQAGYFMFNRKIDRDTFEWEKEFKAKGATPELGKKLDKLEKLNNIGGKAFKYTGIALLAASIIEFIRIYKANQKQ